MKVLMDDGALIDDIDENELKQRKESALATLAQAENEKLPRELKGCSVSELLFLEETAEMFAKHGIPFGTEGWFGAEHSVDQSECYLDGNRMFSYLLNGVFLRVTISDRVAKEKRLWVTPTLASICWQSRSSSRIHWLPVFCIDEEVGLVHLF